MNLHHTIEQLWQRPAKPGLLWLSGLYRRLLARDQRQRLARQVMPPLPLISIGNITVGGSGKTPFTIWLAQQLAAAGCRPVILCRGDGGRLVGPTVVLPEHFAAEVGDEAKLLADESGCPVVMARDRVKACAVAAKLGDLLLLDDGFQYRQLARSCDIVLLSADSLGNEALLPAGPLREPVSALARADLLVHILPHPAILPTIPLNPPLQRGRPEPEIWWRPVALPLRQIVGPPTERPQLVAAVSAIARPQRFYDSLQQLGVTLASCHSFADHHQYSAAEVQKLSSLPDPVVVTAKDAVKLRPLWPTGVPLWLAPLGGEGSPDLPEIVLTPMLRGPVAR